MRPRTLRLAKESLTELATTDLQQVVGGSAATCLTNICPTLDSCITGTTRTE